MRTKTFVVAIGAVAGTGVVVRCRRGIRRAVRRLGRRALAHAHYMLGELQGVVYRLSGFEPDVDAPDDVIADRIRSRIGPLQKRLDVPHVNVMVNEHVASLHGDVAIPVDAAVIEAAVERVPGVVAVDSHLHIGFVPGDTRPSQGGRVTSEARRRLLRAAAEAGGVDEVKALDLVQAVLRTLAERLPSGERRHFLGHLPADVRRLAKPRFGRLEAVGRIRTGTEFCLAVSGAARFPYHRTAHVCEAVLGIVRELVPEEAADISAVLPNELRALWTAAVPG